MQVHIPLTPIFQSPPSSDKYLSQHSTDTQRVPYAVSPTPSVGSSATIPEQKHKIIRNTFIYIFKEATKLDTAEGDKGKIEWLLQSLKYTSVAIYIHTNIWRTRALFKASAVPQMQ